jgi:hypothetical protein
MLQGFYAAQGLAPDLIEPISGLSLRAKRRSGRGGGRWEPAEDTIFPIFCDRCLRGLPVSRRCRLCRLDARDAHNLRSERQFRSVRPINA